MKTRTIYQLDWGITHYNKALAKQRQLVTQRINGEISDTLIFTEHHPVYTLGVRKSSSDNILWNPEKLRNQGIAIAKTNRGGDITYHGPGQIVGYPIISLHHKKDLHTYLRTLEQVLINTLGHHGLACNRLEGKTGIWLCDKKSNRKIAAMGIAVKQWTTYHGFALNVNTNLNHFQGIIPCGITTAEGKVTSIKQELGMSIDSESVKKTIFIEFHSLFYNN